MKEHLTRAFALRDEATAILDQDIYLVIPALHGSTQHLPVSLDWGIYLRVRPFGDSKIDLCAPAAEEAARLMEYERSLARELSPEPRNAILKIKAAVHTDREYKRGFGANQVYDSVLHHAIRDLDGFAAHLEKTTGLKIAI